MSIKETNVARRDVLRAGGSALLGGAVGGCAAIKSIIPPSLASHVRRETVKFIDELKRAA